MSDNVGGYKMGGPSKGTGKQYFNGIDPTGIIKGLRLESIKFLDDKDRLDIEWYQESTGMTGTEYFSGAKPTDTPERISINSGKLVHFLSAFVPASVNEEGKDNRWGDEEISVNTFKEFCEFHTSKITIDPTVLFDLKKLYSPMKNPAGAGYVKPVIKVDSVSGKKTFPFRDYGKYPFINSKHAPAVLNIDKDLNNKAYPMFIDATEVKLISAPATNIAPPPPVAGAANPIAPNVAATNPDDMPF